VLLGNARLGKLVPAADAIHVLLDLAHQFLAATRGSREVWHVRDLSGWAESVPGVCAVELPAATADTPLGAIGGAASVHVPLALLTTAQAAAVETYAAGPVVITPSRRLVLPNAADHLPELVAAGLVDDAASPWSAISACVGAPHCAKSLISTRAYATALARTGSPLPRTHVSGCERRCGAPTGDHRDLVAPRDGELSRLVGQVR
jgi:precorrin-3B synthase